MPCCTICSAALSEQCSWHRRAHQDPLCDVPTLSLSSCLSPSVHFAIQQPSLQHIPTASPACNCVNILYCISWKSSSCCAKLSKHTSCRQAVCYGMDFPSQKEKGSFAFLVKAFLIMTASSASALPELRYSREQLWR